MGKACDNLIRKEPAFQFPKGRGFLQHMSYKNFYTKDNPQNSPLLVESNLLYYIIVFNSCQIEQLNIKGVRLGGFVMLFGKSEA
jgi:hypothetical protein